MLHLGLPYRNATHNFIVGVVTRAHACAATVRVRVMRRAWHRHLRKDYFIPEHFLADDHAHACVVGDVVSIANGYLRTSRHKRHVVTCIMSPVRTGEVRKEPEGIEGWIRRREEKRVKKLERREERRTGKAKAQEVDVGKDRSVSGEGGEGRKEKDVYIARIQKA